MDINLASNNMTSTFPIGTILPILFSNPTSPPTGWLLCDGSQFSTENYPNLAEKVPSGILPDLRDYVLVVAGKSYPESQKIGASTHTIDESEMPSHQHFGVGSKGNNVNGFWESSNSADWGVNYIGFDTNKPVNYLWGTSFTGGTGLSSGNVTKQIPTVNGSNTYVYRGDSKPISLIQPSYPVNYYIYAGTASQEKGNV